MKSVLVFVGHLPAESGAPRPQAGSLYLWLWPWAFRCTECFGYWYL